MLFFKKKVFKADDMRLDETILRLLIKKGILGESDIDNAIQELVVQYNKIA